MVCITYLKLTGWGGGGGGEGKHSCFVFAGGTFYPIAQSSKLSTDSFLLNSPLSFPLFLQPASLSCPPPPLSLSLSLSLSRLLLQIKDKKPQELSQTRAQICTSLLFNRTVAYKRTASNLPFGMRELSTNFSTSLLVQSLRNCCPNYRNVAFSMLQQSHLHQLHSHNT